MHRSSTTRALFASAAVLLATAGCSLEKVDRPDTLRPEAGAVAEAAAGHELHLMFEAHKRNAAFSELPAQF